MRRIHVPALTVGTFHLPADQAHHLRDVLRLKPGDVIQAFDNAGNTSSATIVDLSPSTVELKIEKIEPAVERFRLTIASAIPKTARADWMIEKLSELGVDRFIPLSAERSVALPQGEGKFGRWVRLATESAKQSRRQGVMRIEPLMKLQVLLDQQPDANGPVWNLSTDAQATSILDLTRNLPTSLTLLIGPEGGWTNQEHDLFQQRHVVSVHLTQTVLRIETAAIAAAAIIASSVK